MGEKTPGFPLGPALVLFGIVGVLLIALLAGQPHIPPAAPPTVAPTQIAALPTATQQTANVAYSENDIRQGQTLFVGTCSACHGPDAHGIPGLGKNLAASTFVHDLSDDELLQMIIAGRNVTDPLNTTGIAMPSRGGNPALTDDQLNLIVAYVRSQQAKEAQIAALPTATPGVAATAQPFTLPIAGMNFENVVLPERAFDPAAAYALSCSGCHGAQAEGGSASALTTSPLTDDAIFSFLTRLQPPVDPNVQFPHPVLGEYPQLSDDQLHALIEYLGTLAAS